MRRTDLLAIMGAIWLGLGIAHGKVILSALACVAFVVAGREGRRSRSAADESESESDRWERDKRLGSRLVPGAEGLIPPPRPDVPPPPPPPSGGRR